MTPPLPRGLLPGLLGFALLAACTSPAGAPAPAASADSPAPGAAASAEPAASATGPDPAPSAAPSASAPLPGVSASASAAASAPPAADSGPCPARMIFIAGGTFRRHKPNERKTVTLPGYCLDRAEVTVGEYKQCVQAKKCSPRCLEIGRCSAVPVDADWPDTMETIRASMFCNGSRADRDEHPVNCVSFEEAKGYCEAHDRRLPSGDEWEWAAVANEPGPAFPWGKRAPVAGDLCWGKPYKRSLTCLPGSFPKDTTRDGVVDMAGNLSEWVVQPTARRPNRPQLRGSSWYAVDDGYIQAALWGFDSTSSRSEVFGFRCARDARDSRTVKPAP